MKAFYYSRYRIYHPDYKPQPRFFMISDIHFSPRVKSATLETVATKAREMQPDYILIPGDLVDSLDAIKDHTDRKRLTAWLTQLGAIAPTLISLGNHDYYLKNPDYNNYFSKTNHWFSYKNDVFFEKLRQIPNVHVLDNQVYEDKNIFVLGFSASPEYYQFDRGNKSTSIRHPGSEDRSILLTDLDRLSQKQITNLPKHKAKLVLMHSPVFAKDAAVLAKFNEFDYIISGHMHNGVVPPLLNDFWRTDRGLMAPGKHFFPVNTRTIRLNPSDKSIICGAVTTIQDCAKPLSFLNHAFPIFIATLEFTKDKKYAHKPDVKHKYI